MKAKFIGKDGSLGYRTGSVYNLEVKQRFFGSQILVVSPHPCPYANIQSFLKNWQPIISPIQGRKD